MPSQQIGKKEKKNELVCRPVVDAVRPSHVVVEATLDVEESRFVNLLEVGFLFLLYGDDF